VLSEIGPKACRLLEPASEWVPADDQTIAYWALDVVHACANEQNAEIVINSISRAKISDERTFAKVCLILSLAHAALLDRMMQIADEDPSLRRHAEGLKFMMQAPLCEVEAQLAAANETDRLYACAAVCRRFNHEDLVKMLPKLVKEDLAVTLGDFDSSL
jgi:hypothetical protein